MTNFKTSLKQVVIAGGALFVAIAAPIEASRYMGYDVDVISVASAAEDGHAGQANAKGTKGGTGSKQGGAQGGPQAGSSGKGSKSLEKSVLVPSVDEDSDRPEWAGVKGGKAGAGTKPPGAGTKKGDLFGDLYVLIRDPDTGVALTETIGGVVYPLVQAYDPATGLPVPGVSIPRDPATGDLILTTYTTKEVEFGRLAVARSPTKVLDHSLTEALTKLIAATAISTDNIELILDAAGRLTIVTDGVAKAIDSPLENLALYKAIAALTGTNTTISDGTVSWTLPTTILVPTKDAITGAVVLTSIPLNVDLLKASLLAAASDKTGTVTLDVVMNTLSTLKTTDDLTAVSYDRLATYGTVYTTVLVTTDGGTTWVKTTVSVYDAVFGVNSTNVVVTDATGAVAFTQAADDALQVLEFIHEYAVPVLPTSTVTTAPTVTTTPAPVVTDTKVKEEKVK
jgi:hypothetical protein